MYRNGQKPKATKYVKGTNQYLDRIIPEGVEVYIVQGALGRKPIAAGTAQEAIDKYATTLHAA